MGSSASSAPAICSRSTSSTAGGAPPTRYAAFASLARAAVGSRPALEADRVPLALTSWKAGLGYDPAFLSVELTLDAILGDERAAAASLKGSTSIALDYMHFSTVIHEKRKFAMLTAVNIDRARLVNPGGRSDTWRQDARIAAEYQPAGDF
jgi:endonuclease G